MTGVLRVRVLAEHELVAAALGALVAGDSALALADPGAEPSQPYDVLLIHLGTVPRVGAGFLLDAGAAAHAAAARGVRVVVIVAGQPPVDWPRATPLPPDVAPAVLLAAIRGS